MVNNSTNINKTKESLNSDVQQFHQYQQNKRKRLKFTTLVVIGTDCIGSYKSHYYMITTTTTPSIFGELVQICTILW